MALRLAQREASHTTLCFSKPDKGLELLEIKGPQVPGLRKLNPIPKIEKVGLGVGQKLMSGIGISSR